MCHGYPKFQSQVFTQTIKGYVLSLFKLLEDISPQVLLKLNELLLYAQINELRYLYLKHLLTLLDQLRC